jgi:cytochrome P450
MAVSEPARPVTNVEPGLTTLTRYHEVVEALRNPALVSAPDLTDPFAARTVRRLHGSEHLTRRRALSRLLMKGGDRWFRENVLFPTVEQNLAGILARPDPDGYARVDLFELGNRLFIQQSAAIAGFRGTDVPEAADRLYELLGLIRVARMAWLGAKESDIIEIATESRDEAEVKATVEAGLAAKQEILERFFRPGLAEHQALLARVEAGELDAQQLPRDFLMVIALRADPAWEDEDLALREIITDTLSAGVDSSVQLLCKTADEVFRWMDAHPGESGRRHSPEFIKGALNETLRLRPQGVGVIRTAIEDVALSNGVEVPAGARVVIDRRIANRDPEVFGPDAGEFNPDRVVPTGVLPYGVAFGAGPHMCFGQPLVVGSPASEGTHDHLFRRLFEAGLDRDPDRRASTDAITLTQKFTSYPARLQPGAV